MANFVHENKIGWLDVPNLVQDLFVKYAAPAADLVQGEPTLPGGWILTTDEVGPVLLVKQAFEPMAFIDSIPKALGHGMDVAQKAVGGPNPLTATLLGGALGAGLGYGGGWLAHKIAPKYVDESAARKWALMGGLGAGVIPALIHGYPNVRELGLKGLVQPSRYQGRQGNVAGLRSLLVPGQPVTAEMQDEMNAAEAFDRNELPAKETLAACRDLFGIEPTDDDFIKNAVMLAGSQLGEIPTDQWGRVIMYDPYLDDSSKAVASGLPYAAASATGSRWVTPRDVMNVAANTALGRGLGWGIGQLAKTFLGFTPEVQDQMQQVGTLAGAVRGVMGMLS